ncbi:uncharacterized protein LOC111696241 [Eurytemora carolleeae]|uniref:uncharacterized protein LOC111696241 n=1 Tax=Eurytemora carolleeae TaxID=1294199 RepID=UPI000C771B39|nr:uncharacterized protein LOC111696241 [Eurytemora carolleeae]|eukprot:XP_023321562.1 uncharacterized protein LOC111696241 [Eurytemora affinis]
MLRKGRRSRAGSLSSPSHELPPRLGISGLYTDYMDRRNHSSGGGSVSPTSPIPTPPPPVHVSTLGRWGFPTNGISNGHPPFSNSPPMHIETSRELTRRINELGSNHDLDVPDSMGHLHLDNFNRRLPQPYTQTYHHPARMGSESIGIRSGISKPYKH